MPSIQRYTPAGGSPYVFSDTGRPRYSASATYENPGRQGLPRRKIVRHRLTQWFSEPGWADNMARFTALKAALANAEGVLYIEDEGGNARVNCRVRVLTHDLPEQWGQWMAEVKVEFESVEEISGPAQLAATFTPDVGDPVSLGDVRQWSQKQNTERYSILVPNRRESRLNVSASGSIRANPASDPPTRRAALQASAAALLAVDKVDGVLAWGAFSQRMRILDIVPDLGDATDEIRWSLTAEMLTFPSGDFCEAEWKVAQKDDTAANERITTVAGTIRAHDEAAALAKRDAIQTYWTASTRLFKGGEWHISRLDGADGATDLRSWDFSLAWREPMPGAVASYTLRIATHLDETTGLMTTTYSGRVTAANTADALACARSLGQNKLPMKLAEDEDVNTVSLAGSAAQHTEVTFSYSYESRGAETHAEVTSETNRDTFGACVQTISGWAVGTDAATALAFARTFKQTGVLVQGEREGEADDYHASSSIFKRVPFAYTYRLATILGSIEYGVATEDNFDTRETVTTYSGTARASSSGAADSLISALVSGLTGRWVVNRREPKFLAANTSVFDCTTFTIGKAVALSNGEDILDAEVTVTTQPSFNKAVIDPIPYGTPYAQSNVGVMPGSQVATGTVTAVNASTAKAWARQWVPGGSAYQTQADTEAVTTKYLPRSGTSVACTRIAFTYPRAYVSLGFT